MESHGISGEIQVSSNVYHILKDKYLFEERGTIQVKGKGEMAVYLLKKRLLS
jgi:class 3 adenylate cyclase